MIYTLDEVILLTGAAIIGTAIMIWLAVGVINNDWQLAVTIDTFIGPTLFSLGAWGLGWVNGLQALTAFFCGVVIILLIEFLTGMDDY